MTRSPLLGRRCAVITRVRVLDQPDMRSLALVNAMPAFQCAHAHVDVDAGGVLRRDEGAGRQEAGLAKSIPQQRVASEPRKRPLRLLRKASR